MGQGKHHVYVYHYPKNRQLNRKMRKYGPFFVDIGEENEEAEFLIGQVKAGRSIENRKLQHMISECLRFGGVVVKRPVKCGSREEAIQEAERLIALYRQRDFDLANEQEGEHQMKRDDGWEEDGDDEETIEEASLATFQRMAQKRKEQVRGGSSGDKTLFGGDVKMIEKRYGQIIRLLAIVTAAALWFISMQFSAEGFAFAIPRFAWVGYVLAFAITVIEIVFNEDGMNHSITVVVLGILAYAYGIVTNVIGIYAAQGSPDLSQEPYKILFPVLLGLFLEIAPEMLLMWALIGTNTKDLFSHLLGDRGGRN